MYPSQTVAGPSGIRLRRCSNAWSVKPWSTDWRHSSPADDNGRCASTKPAAARTRTFPSPWRGPAIALTGSETPGLLEEEAAFATLESMTIAHDLVLADDLLGNLPGGADLLAAAATTVTSLSPFQLSAFDWSSRLLAADVAERAAGRLPRPLADSLRGVAVQLQNPRATHRLQLRRPCQPRRCQRRRCQPR